MTNYPRELSRIIKLIRKHGDIYYRSKFAIKFSCRPFNLKIVCEFETTLPELTVIQLILNHTRGTAIRGDGRYYPSNANGIPLSPLPIGLLTRINDHNINNPLIWFRLYDLLNGVQGV